MTFNQEIVLRFAAEIIGKSATFILAIFLARSLGVSGFAAIGNANLIVAAALPLLSFGLSFTLVRVTAGLIDSKSVSEHYYTSLAVAGTAALIFALALWNISPYITQYLFDDITWLQFVKLTTFYCIFTVVELITLETLRARQMVKSASCLQILAAFINLTTCFLLESYDALTPNKVLLILTGTRIFTALLAHICLIKYKQVTVKVQLCDLAETKKAISLGLPFAASGFGTWMIEHGDRFVLTTFMKQIDFGSYIGALTILSVISICGAPFWYLLFPKMAKAHSKNDKIEFRYEGKKAISYYGIIVFPIAIFITIALPTLLPELAGNSFQISYVTSIALTVSLLVVQLGSPWEYACIVTGSSKSYLKNTLFFGIIGILIGSILVQFLGALGVAIAAIISRIGLTISLYRLSSNMGYGSSLLPDSKVIFSILTAAIPTSILSFILMQQDFFLQNHIIKSILVYGLSFLPVFLLFYASYRIVLLASGFNKYSKN